LTAFSIIIYVSIHAGEHRRLGIIDY